MKTFINLTPHAIVLALSSGDRVYIPASGAIARVVMTPVDIEEVDVPGIPVPVIPARVAGPIEGLPEPEEGTVYLVSFLVLHEAKGRTDVFAPATGPTDGAIRTAAGQIDAVTRLVAAPK